MARQVVTTIIGLCVILGCSHSSKPASAGKTTSPPQMNRTIVALFAGRAFHPENGSVDHGIRQDVLGHLRSSMDHTVKPLDIRTPVNPGQIRSFGALLGGEVAIQFKSAGPDSDFLTVTAYEVASGKLISESAFHQGPSPDLVPSIVKWFQSLSASFLNAPPFEVESVGRQIKKDGVCNDLNDAASRIPSSEKDSNSVTTLLATCQGYLTSRGERNTSVEVLKVKVTGVPSSSQEKIYAAASDANIEKQTRELSNRYADLVVQCTSGCQEAKIRLVAPFERSWYENKLNGRKDLLAPYRPLAASLADFRLRVSHILGRPMPTELLLQDITGNEIKFEVTGDSNSVKLKPSRPPEDFFRQNP